ncbi:unnamed protein product, partial [Polarella glacialis]
MASRCRQWLLLGAALALLPGLQGDDTISPPADSDPRGNILQCGSEEKERWLRVKKHLDVMVPRLTGRLNFVALREDIPILEAIQTELLDGLGIPQEMLKADSPMPSWEVDGWSQCHSAVLASRVLFVVTQVTAAPAKAAIASASIAASVMAAPWDAILFSDWPVFTLLAILSRWASPYADERLAQASGTHGRAARSA